MQKLDPLIAFFQATGRLYDATNRALTKIEIENGEESGEDSSDRGDNYSELDE